MICILCSAIGLGTYVPSVLIAKQLERRGIEASILVFETFLEDDQRDAIIRARTAYQHNAALLRISQRLMPKTILNAKVNVCALLDLIGREPVTRYVVLSGVWLPFIELLRKGIATPVDYLHIDSVTSPSWWVPEQLHRLPATKHFWISNYSSGTIDYRIDVSCPRIAFHRRRNAVIAHGGGWSVGTYNTASSDISAAGYEVHIVLPNHEQQPAWSSGVYRADPAWEAWRAADPSSIQSGHAMPPLLGGTIALDDVPNRQYHDLLEIARQVKCIVSKPGGATLLDCLASSTPLVYVQPEGDHEAHNAALWRSLGLAISLEDWAKNGYSVDVLYKVHLRLKETRRTVPCYADRISLG